MSRRLSETELAAGAGLSLARLRVFVQAQCVRPREEEGRLVFGEADLARVRLLRELTADLELDDDAASLVLSLLDQIHGLRRELRCLAEAVAAEPEEIRVRIRNRHHAATGGISGS